MVQLLPRDQRFFELFTRVATLNVEAAKALRELFATSAGQRSHLLDIIKRL